MTETGLGKKTPTQIARQQDKAGGKSGG